MHLNLRQSLASQLLLASEARRCSLRDSRRKGAVAGRWLGTVIRTREAACTGLAHLTWSNRLEVEALHSRTSLVQDIPMASNTGAKSLTLAEGAKVWGEGGGGGGG